MDIKKKTAVPKAAFVVAFASMVAFMGIGLVDPILNKIAHELQATPAQTTLLFTSYLMVTGIIMLFTGFISSRIGAKKTMMVGLVIIVIFSALGAMSQSIDALIYFRAGWGFGNALFISTALSAIVTILVGQTERAIMIYEAAMGLGMSIGPLLGGSLGSMSWRFPFVGVATLMTISFLAITVFLKEKKETSEKKVHVGFFAGVKALAQPKLRGVGLIALLYNFGFFTLLAYAPFLMSGFTELQTGFTFFGWGVLLAISSIFLATRIERKIGTLATIMLAMIGFFICLAVIGLGADSSTTVASALIVAGFFQGIINTLMTTVAMEIPDIPRNIASSSYSFIRFFGGSLAQFIAGRIAERYSGAHAFYFASFMVFLGIVLLIVYRRFFLTNEEAEVELTQALEKDPLI
ncbi:MFS transporter [Enterococcus bulliens]